MSKKMAMWWMGALIGGLSAIAQASAAPAQAVPLDSDAGADAGDVACGEKGQPDCPLQGWMNKNIKNVKATGTKEQLAKNLALIPTLAPKAEPKWAEEWRKIADAAVKAVEAGDKDGINASCKSCHDKYRDEYKKKYRKLPLPPPAPKP